MLWDVFCRVIDNFGDIGVCWRLSADLASRGHRVRLWLDDASALAWMAPEVAWQAAPTREDSGAGPRVGTGHAGIEVRDWADAQQKETAPEPGEVVIEAFGCDPPAAFLSRMNRALPPAWVNLEYLSAESYVERSHGLPSPVSSGPAAGLRKHFFYPGFTSRTGGLLREPGLAARQAAFTPDASLAWLNGLGVPATPACHLVSVFCYRDAPLGEWLSMLAQDAGRHARPTRVLLTPGHASELARAWQAQAPRSQRDALICHELPALPQPEFDCLLWACHLNVVRGEDSAVRALWAGKPHIWHIYPQDDGVHADKLEAFLSRWLAKAPPELAAQVCTSWRHFNRLPGPAEAAPVSAPALPDWRNPGSEWARSSRQARDRLLAQDDLVTQLLAFVAPFVTSSG
jgi:uncharacterized repeat protein (TIGR03837 family)